MNAAILAYGSAQYLQFLQTIHGTGVSCQKHIRVQLMEHYRDYWLPLVASSTRVHRKDLVPLPDIAWLWHCHHLASTEYVKYMQE